MITLSLSTSQTINVELKPTISNPYWLFVFKFDDLKGKIVKSFLTPSNTPNWQTAFTDDIVPGLSWNRYYSFVVDTNNIVLRTGDWTLFIYEKSTNANQDYSTLTAQYVSKVRIYKQFAANPTNTLTLEDERYNS